MLLKKLVFDNYKTYYGHQEVDFYIPEDVRKNEHKNIILLGGLNGAGKTTILKAILFVLFGKRGMKEQEYKRLFSNVINNTFFDEGGRECSVSLTIESVQKEEWDLKVKWSFDNNKRATFEQRELTVRKPGAKFGKSTQIQNIEAYNRLIDKMIPYHAAPFFIFDGEEIKDIILRQNSDEMKEAIHKITGMEAYKLLLKDLETLKSNLETKLANSVKGSKLNHLQTEMAEVKEQIKNLEDKISESTKERRKYQELIDIAKQKRNEKISQNSKSREEIVKKQSRFSTELKLAKEELDAFFKQNVLSILLSSKLSTLKTRLRKENEFSHKRLLQETSLTPYRNFIGQLLSRSITPPLTDQQLDQIKKIGEEIWIKEYDIKKHVSEDFIEIHDISKNDYNFLMNMQLKDKNQIVTLINKIDRLQQEVDTLEIEIRNAPEAVNVEEEYKKIDLLTKNLGVIDANHKKRSQKLRVANDQLMNIKNKLTRLSGQDVNFEEIQNRLEYTDKLVTAMKRYIKEFTTLKAQFIREEFSNMLSTLFRKRDEFGKIEFDIHTYSIRLFNDRMQEISIQDRSAGEMQMISSALIWALTKASDLALPMVIDTPLGRLDSYHRNHLINHYYKNLSEQVIILSTDTEITSEYVSIMKDHSYRQYMLNYDESKKYTVIRDGYFEFVKD